MNDFSTYARITDTTSDGTATESSLPDDTVDMIGAMLRVVDDMDDDIPF